MEEKNNPNPEDETYDDEANYFGPSAWIVGLALAAVLIALLFGLADGISG
jgi:hypothetical protein